jgi:hypothetical protein
LYMALQSHGNIVEGGFATYTGLVKLTPQLEFLDSIPVKTVVLKEYWRGGYPFKHFLSKNEGVFTCITLCLTLKTCSVIQYIGLRETI